jgi:hypothetical protein
VQFGDESARIARHIEHEVRVQQLFNAQPVRRMPNRQDGRHCPGSIEELHRDLRMIDGRHLVSPTAQDDKNIRACIRSEHEPADGCGQLVWGGHVDLFESLDDCGRTKLLLEVEQPIHPRSGADAENAGRRRRQWERPSALSRQQVVDSIVQLVAERTLPKVAHGPSMDAHASVEQSCQRPTKVM